MPISLLLKIKMTKRRGKGEKPEVIDIGMVGEVKAINPRVIEALEKENFIPVIAPIGVGTKGRLIISMLIW